MLHPHRSFKKIWDAGISIGIVRTRRNHPACLNPRLKSNNSLNTILAKMEAQHMRVFEGILLNLDGYLSEGTTSNIFFVKKGVLHTPSPACGLLEGVTRGVVIQQASRLGLKVREGRYGPRDLAAAEEVFLSSTTLEVAPVVSLVQFRHSRGPALRRHLIASGRPGPLTRRLREQFRIFVQKELCYNSKLCLPSKNLN